MQLTETKRQKVRKFHKTRVLLVSAMDNKEMYVIYGIITLVYFFSISPVDLVEPDGEVILDFLLK